ncbi:MAG: peroxiredoxin [Candidatus Micrarchaeota archaeon]|nr:MAG: peroxiredoxin [Candidatus Micrarchaeota archaeon]
MALKEGEPAPEFELDGNDGKKHSLSEFKGRYLVLYFYPKDNTPGCSIEADNFNKRLDEIRALNAEVVGVSKDDLKSHDKFKEKYNLRFLLLSDPESKVIKAYGAYGNRGAFGFGTLRKTFIIDPNGNIAKIYNKVQPIKHAQEVIDFLKSVNR